MIIDRFATINKTKGVFNVNPAYVVIPKEKNNLTPRQKKLKARKVSRQSRIYNLKRGK